MLCIMSWKKRRHHQRSKFDGLVGDDAMDAPDQQRMTPQVSENAAVEQVDLHFVELLWTQTRRPST